MYFTSRTDLTVVQTPTAPTMGPAGSIVVDPDFNNQIVRVTDENSIILNGQPSNVYAGIGGSADVNVWNTDSTMLYLEDDGGGGAVFGFTPSTLGVQRLFPGWRVLNSLVFSRLDPNVAFVLTGTQFFRYDLSNRTLNVPPTPILICDFAGQLPSGATWKTMGGVELSDTLFTAAFSVSGGQGTGVYVCAYYGGPINGFRTLNTSTGVITGNFGPTGTISIPDRWTIHNVKLSKDGTTLIIALTHQTAGSDNAPFFWTVNSMNVFPMGNTCVGGHWTGGYGEFINNASSATIPTWAHCRRPFTNMNAPTQIANPVPNPAVMFGIDDHLSYNGVQNSMFAVSSTDNGSKVSPPYPAAWWNEILGFDLSGNGKVYRFCHHFSNTRSTNFYAYSAIGAVDQLNQYFVFTSDWQTSLLNGRIDAFIVKFT